MKNDHRIELDLPDESSLVGTAQSWDPSIFKKSVDSYAEYFTIFDRYGRTKDPEIAKIAFSYMAMGERGLMARGVESIRVIPRILKETSHPWIRESMATISGLLMSEKDFKSTFLKLLSDSNSESEVVDMIGVAACLKGRRRELVIGWILESNIDSNLKEKLHELI